MQFRKFGNTDLLVSEVGFGAWAIGGKATVGSTILGWGDTDDAVSTQAIHQSLDQGINFFDTADIYGFGHSENIIGELLGKRKDVIIATKVGNVVREEQFTTDYSKEHIISACEASLKRLRRDTIDFYQLHTARMPQLEQGDCIEAMHALQQQGKIRYWGLSLNTFEPAPEAEFLINEKSAHGFQLVLNILNQNALAIMKKAAENGYGVIIRIPLQFGLLTGKFDQAVSFSKDDHRKNRLTPEIVKQAGEALRPVWGLCKKYDLSKTELALSYILSYKEVSTVIPGIRTAAQAISNTKGLMQLAKEDMELIEHLGETDFVAVMKAIRERG